MTIRRSLDIHLINQISPAHPISLNHPICQEAHAVYEKNCAIAVGLSAIPGISALLSWHMVEAVHRAEEIWSRVQKDSETEAEREEQVKNLSFITLQDVARENDHKFHEQVWYFTERLDNYVPGMTQQSHSFYEGLLKGVSVMAWTAFEELCRSLWRGIRDSPNQSFMRPTKKEIGKYEIGLGSRRKIRNAYQFAFRSLSIDSVIASAIIDPLAMLRNVIVHSASVIDADFDAEFRNFPQLQRFSNMRIGDSLPIDGALVHSVVDPAFKAGYELLQQTDIWLQNHP